MSKSSTQELDQSIQVSLVSRIRHAATVYNAAPANSPEALDIYLAALEGLADYVAAKWRGAEVAPAAPAATQRVPGNGTLPIRQESLRRLIAFGPLSEEQAESAPQNAA